MQLFQSIPLVECHLIYGATRRAIFTRTPPIQGPFVRKDWPIIAVPYGMRVEPDVFETVGRVIQAYRGTASDLIIADAEDAWPEYGAVRLPWSSEARDKARFDAGSLLDVTDSHWFDDSRLWGAVAAASLDDILLFGAETVLAERVIDSLGGHERVAAAFRAFADVEWSIGAETRQAIFQLAGWPDRRTDS